VGWAESGDLDEVQPSHSGSSFVMCADPA